jgi:hypothetical protein
MFMTPTSMTRRLPVLAVAATALLLGGCASSPKSPADKSAEAPAARLAPEVKLPAGSARKVVMTMTGPKDVVEAKDWGDFKREWRDTFAEHAKGAGIAFSFVEKAPAPGGEAGTLLAVDVADYRMVGIGMRIMFGIMTGNAYIDAKVRYVGLADGKALGEQQFNTTSSAAGGVFAKVTPQQVDQIAASVFGDLNAAR